MNSDRGASTIFTTAWVMVLSVIGSLGMGLVQAQLVAARTQAAADLAAIAGSQATGDPCQRAWSVARANQTELIGCSRDRGDLVVTVRSWSPSLLSRVTSYLDHRTDSVQATARAGYPSS